MDDKKQVEDGNTPERYIKLSESDANFVILQLATAMERANKGNRLGSHLIKRMRKSRAILTGAVVSDERVVLITPVQHKTIPPKVSLWKRLTGWSLF